VSQRRHAASDGSFAKSAGGAAGRGLLLIAVAVIVGVLLLRNGFDDTGGASSAPTTSGGGAVTSVSPDTTAVDGSTDSTEPTTPTSVRPPNQVKVFVANAAGVQGAAGRASDTLKAAGYVAVAGNSPTRVDTTTIYYTEGFQGEANAVAAALGAPPTSVQPMPTPPPVADIQGAQVLVVLGPDVAKPA
jgi:LytR cell envelope-related transcriptional attenuator